jgi:3-oxoacyl-[acyl-carrier protein] reductase
MMFNGQVVVVTGATRGIGLSIAKAFAEQGASIAICSTKDDQAKKVAADIGASFNVQTYGEGVDIKDFDAVGRFFDNVCDLFGQVDVLVNNAGITRDNLLLRLQKDDWDDVINVNLNSIFNTTKSVMKRMLKKKYGRIINIASVVGLMGNPGQSNYAAAKGGMIAFSKSVAREYGKKNITVNTVAPGFIETEMIESLPKEYLSNIIDNIPMSRLGTPSDVSRAVMFLASKDASYITGQVISVDGGMYM